eukprot:5437923-Pyramimonas_sp.AAC.1
MQLLTSPSSSAWTSRPPSPASATTGCGMYFGDGASTDACYTCFSLATTGPSPTWTWEEHAAHS